MGRPSSFTNKTRRFRCPSMAAHAPSYVGYPHSSCPEGCCLFNTAHMVKWRLCANGAVAGGDAHGTACTDSVAIVRLSDVVAFLSWIAGTPPPSPTFAFSFCQVTGQR